MLTDIFPLIFCANYLPTESVVLVGEKNVGEYFLKVKIGIKELY